jgi:hypothetical protein
MAAAGCASDSSGACDFPDNVVYEAHYTELAGGTCGPLETKAMTLSQPIDPSVDCTREPWMVRDRGCTRERVWSCSNGASAAVSTVVLNAADGGNWTGTYTAHASGDLSCASVYDIVLVRL